MAAQLAQDEQLTVRLEAGKLGEMRVEVDGHDVFRGSRVWYPRPSRVVAEVRRRVRGTAEGK